MRAKAGLTSLMFVDQLRKAGVDALVAEAQAKATLEMMVNTLDVKLTTNDDLNQLESRMDLKFAAVKDDLSQLESRMDLKFAAVKDDLSQLESRMDLKFAAVKDELTQLAS